MANTEGMVLKFVVLKVDDLKGVALTHPHLINNFNECLMKVEELRRLEGKRENNYLVINTDEPYADEVIEIMKLHGHWG